MKKIYTGIISFLLIISVMGCSSKTKINKNTSSDNKNTSINESSSNINSFSLNNNNNSIKPIDQQSSLLSNLSMMNETTGWILKGNRVLRATDGGGSWSDVSPYKLDADKLNSDETHISVYFYNSNTAWIAAGTYSQDKELIIYHTADGGEKWSKSNLPVTEDWEYSGSQDISFIDEKNGYILVNSSPACGMMDKSIYKTTDGGIDWVKISDISDKIAGYPTGMTFKNVRKGWITSQNHGQNYIPAFKTNDGGLTWNKENLQIPKTYKTGYYANCYQPVFFRGNGILPVEYTGNGSQFIIPYLTYDGGASWLIPCSKSNEFSCFDFYDENQWWAIDYQNSKLLCTSNHGSDWNEISQNELFEDIKSLKFVSKNVGWAIGDYVFIKTIDGGKSWSKVNGF